MPNTKIRLRLQKPSILLPVLFIVIYFPAVVYKFYYLGLCSQEALDTCDVKGEILTNIAIAFPMLLIPDSIQPILFLNPLVLIFLRIFSGELGIDIYVGIVSLFIYYYLGLVIELIGKSIGMLKGVFHRQQNSVKASKVKSTFKNNSHQ